MDLPTLHYDHICGAQPRWKNYLEVLMNPQCTPETRRAVYKAASFSTSAQILIRVMESYVVEGQQTFVVGPRLQKMFAETEIDGIHKDMIKLPYLSFYIALPDCEWRVWGGPLTKFHPLRGVYIQHMSPGVALLLGWGAENENSKYVGDDATMWFRWDLTEASDKMGRLYVEKKLKAELNDPDEDSSDPEARIEPVGQADIMAEQQESYQKLLRVVMNTLLYLSSIDPETQTQDCSKRVVAVEKQLTKLGPKPKGKNKKKARKLRKKLSGLTHAKVTWIGPTLEEAEEEEIVRTGSGRVVRKHLRRGHWHRYWVGKRKDAAGNRIKGTERVHRWIKPQWVGQDIANQIQVKGRIYRFREERS